MVESHDFYSVEAAGQTERWWTFMFKRWRLWCICRKCLWRQKMLFFRWLVLVSMCFSELKLRFVLASRFKCKKRQVPVVKMDGKSGRETLSGAIDLQQVGADDTANMCRSVWAKVAKTIGPNVLMAFELCRKQSYGWWICVYIYININIIWYIIYYLPQIIITYK